jgi:Ankyrin repeats (3 copies)
VFHPCLNVIGYNLLSAVDVLRRYVEEDVMVFWGIRPILINSRSKEGETPLFAAVYRGLADEVVALINGGADINAIDIYGIQPLHSAIFGRKVEIVKILIERGADLSHINLDGETALQAATSRSFSEIVTLIEQALITTKTQT